MGWLLLNAAYADGMVSGLFGDNMVLQRGMQVPIWGTAEPGGKVTVQLGEATASVVADGSGKWIVRLPAMKEDATPRDLVITGKTTQTLKNVVVGDVWVCSGQSNMELALGGCDHAKEDIEAANYPAIRRFKVSHRSAAKPESVMLTGQWQVCSPRAPVVSPL